MLRYMLVVLLYAITYCMALHNETELSAHGLEVQQIIYIYGPRQWKIQESNNLIEKVANGYSITSDVGAHKFHSVKMSWNNARKVCIQEGGHLAVINSIAEETILLRIMQENKIDAAWLGIHDLYEEGDWNTIMDQPLAATGYIKWAQTPGWAPQPDNYNQNEHCGAFVKQGGLNDADCTLQSNFFCEIAL